MTVLQDGHDGGREGVGVVYLPALTLQLVVEQLRCARDRQPTLLRGFGPSPSSGSSKASPTLRDLETTFRSLSSDLSPSTAQGVLDGLESPLDGLAR